MHPRYRRPPSSIALFTVSFFLLVAVVGLAHLFHIIPSLTDGQSDSGVQEILAGETRFGILHIAEQGRLQNADPAALTFLSPPPPPSPLSPPPSPTEVGQSRAEAEADQAARDEAEYDAASALQPDTKKQGAALSPATSTSCPPLSKTLLERVAKRNTVLVTFVGYEMFTIFGPTWVANVQEAGIRYQVLAVPDNKTARLVSGFGVPCFLLDQVDIQDVNTAFHWGSDTWRAHTWQKVAIVRSVNRLGFNVVHSDIDVVWFRDPLDFFTQQHTVPDYMVSMDPITTQNDLGDTGLEKGISVGHYMNTGVYFLRASPGGSALIDKWHSLRAQYIRQYHDQDGLYQYLAKQAVVEYDYPHRVALIKEQGTKLAQLPATLFQNAYSHCINKVHKLHQVQPFETHMVWTYGNNLGKAHRMREYMYFRDPPEYYNTGRYLSVQLSPVTVPPDFNTWNDTVAMAQHHWKSIQQQLSELYYAFALAYTSSRILILPRLTCFCIHNWFESPLCRLPGETITQLPMDCPADYLFNMPVLYNLRMDMRVIRIREYSFLENPRTHHRYKAAPFLISAKELQFPEHKPRHHYLPLKYKDLELNAELERLHAEPRLHVLNPKALFSNFSFPHYQNVFNKLMSSLAIRWCCLPRKDMDRVGIRDEGFQLAVSP